jgi:hypothetical protein
MCAGYSTVEAFINAVIHSVLSSGVEQFSPSDVKSFIHMGGKTTLSDTC